MSQADEGAGEAVDEGHVLDGVAVLARGVVAARGGGAEAHAYPAHFTCMAVLELFVGLNYPLGQSESWY